MPAVGDGLAYVSGESAFFAGTLRDNLTYSLRKTPAELSAEETEEARKKLAEAQGAVYRFRNPPTWNSSLQVRITAVDEAFDLEGESA